MWAIWVQRAPVRSWRWACRPHVGLAALNWTRGWCWPESCGSARTFGRPRPSRPNYSARSAWLGRAAHGRLAARLVELAERYGEVSDAGIVIGVPLSQEELAAWVGASHAGVAKALQTLRELGWIGTQRRRIVVHDLEALRGRSP